MQALMLAAGMGSRLGKFTANNTKCMLDVTGTKLIDRAIEAVKLANIRKFIIVVGYKGENLIKYINSKYTNSDMEFVFINNKDYVTSNNIYSFYLAKDYMLQDDTILLESDLIYDKQLIKKMVDDCNPNLVAVAKYESWMDGTVVTCDENKNITQFISKIDMDIKLLGDYYKTVNVYKFSKDFLRNIYLPFLTAYMQAYGLNSYYETVLKVVAHIKNSSLKAYCMDDMLWYEIDDEQDLDIATVLFSSGKNKYNNIISKFGGYWRYNKMLDFCYLVNPYFPPKEMTEKMQNEFPVLLSQYPSGLNMQNMNAERMFGVSQENILVGNGAAELINVFGMVVKGKIAVNLPTFNEYVRCFRNSELICIDNSTNDYKFDIDRMKEIMPTVDYMCIVSPDNPSGDMLTKKQILELLHYAKQCNTTVVIDESFIDFAYPDERYTLLDNSILNENNNLCVIKSISKSYGVPALRLGVFASANKELLRKMRDYMQVWNINSFAEYFLQIYNLYAKTYAKACDRIASERFRVIGELSRLKGIKVYPSQANYIMIDLQKFDSESFCIDMLDKYNILIKNLATKNFFNGKNFIRVAIRNEDENNKLIEAMKKLLN